MVNEQGIEFEYVDLPSKGECYPHKKGRVPVAYMTAKDENIVASEELRAKGKDIDVLLNTKMLDSDFRAEELCVGDRDAILLWLYRTGYGEEYIEPVSGETINLKNITNGDFDYFADKQGIFNYATTDGVLLQYKLPTNADDRELKTTFNSDESSNDIELIDKGCRLLLQRQTVRVGEETKKETICGYIESLGWEEQQRYLHFINRHTPRIMGDLDLEQLFHNKIRTISNS